MLTRVGHINLVHFSTLLKRVGLFDLVQLRKKMGEGWCRKLKRACNAKRLNCFRASYGDRAASRGIRQSISKSVAQ
jgi:hypothetical protein